MDRPPLKIYIAKIASKTYLSCLINLRASGNLTLAIARPGLNITQRALNMVDKHLKLVERNGCIFFYGVKPRTWLYHVNCHPTKGWPHMKLTPIV